MSSIRSSSIRLLPLLFLLFACGTDAPGGGSADGGSNAGRDGGSNPGSDGGTAATPPTVAFSTPTNGATDVAVNLPVRVTFDRAMAPATLTPATFLLKHGNTNVAGTVTYTNRTATFTPTAVLPAATLFTATVTTGVKDALGTALAAPRSWSFTTVAADAAPTVTSTFPASNATGVWTGQHAMIVFNAAMDPTTMTAVNYTLTQGATPVAGTVAYDAPSNTASFTPAVALAFSTTYTASMSTGAKSATGRNLAAARTWSFTTAAAAAMTLPVNLRTAGNYVILAKTAISTVPASAVTGDLGLSPAAATFVTGFSLTADSTTTFSRSTQVTGRVFAASYTSPTPALLTTAVSDMETAFTDAASRPADVTELGAGNIGGRTLTHGVYKWGTGLLIPSNVTLVGSATDVWIFQIAQDLIVASGARISLSGGALAKNVFWQVAGLIDLGTTAHVEGVLICQTAITLHTGASVNGRLLAQSAVSIDGSTVVAPAP